jgi:hypothetical protein
VGRMLPVLEDPYPEFTAEETAATLNVNPNALDESCEAFLDACSGQAQVRGAANGLVVNHAAGRGSQ